MTGIRKDVIFGFIDQALISLSNFIIAFFLIHSTSKENYGLYGLGMIIILLFVGFSNALITTQMSVIAPAKDISTRDKYCCSMLFGQLLIFLPILFFGGAGVVILDKYHMVNHFDYVFYLAVCSAVFGMLLKEFFRRFYYLKLRPRVVLAIDICHVAAVLSVLIIVKFLLQPDDLHVIAMLAVAGGASLSGVIGFLLAKFPARMIDLRFVGDSLKEAWQQGRWALGGVTVTWLQSQSYVYLLGVFVGVSAIAEANAARLLIAPIAMLSTSITSVILPRLALMRNSGMSADVERLARKVLYALIVVTVIYAGFLLIFKDLIIVKLFTPTYRNIGVFILAWNLVFVFQAVRSNNSLLLQVFRKFREITLSNVISSLAVLVCGIFLIRRYGVLGSIANLTFGEILLSILLWKAYKRTNKNNAC